MRKIKSFLISLLLFLFFAMMTAATFFFLIESARCVIHFVDGAESSLMEMICLGLVMLTGGAVGLIYVLTEGLE